MGTRRLGTTCHYGCPDAFVHVFPYSPMVASRCVEVRRLAMDDTRHSCPECGDLGHSLWRLVPVTAPPILSTILVLVIEKKARDLAGGPHRRLFDLIIERQGAEYFV